MVLVDYIGIFIHVMLQYFWHHTVVVSPRFIENSLHKWTIFHCINFHIHRYIVNKIGTHVTNYARDIVPFAWKLRSSGLLFSHGVEGKLCIILQVTQF